MPAVEISDNFPGRVAEPCNTTLGALNRVERQLCTGMPLAQGNAVFDGKIGTENLCACPEGNGGAAIMTVRDLLILNLTLQVFDGLFSYQAFTLGAAEANPLVSAAISSWGMIYGLLYKKLLACALLFLIFVLARRHSELVRRAMIVTASAYTCVAVVCLWQLLR